jgi:TetR/AcrR family transcriptional regulator, cholesterol catabolism regulator
MLVSVSRPSPDLASASARTRLLDAAERLFAARGYASVTLRDIAADLGLTHAALYYHVPGGKVELFVEVTERNIRRHGEGLASRMDEGGPSLRGKLEGAADWLLSQPPMDLIRLAESDLKALSPERARPLMDLVLNQMLRRLSGAIAAAAEAGEIGACDAGLVGGALLGMIESLHAVPDFAVKGSRPAMAYELIGIMLRGLGYEKGGGKPTC